MFRFAPLLALAAAVLAFLPAPPVAAEDKDKDSGAAKFVMDAANGGMLEVALGKLASEKSNNTDVKKFGERMVTDHSKANKELLAVAGKKGYKVPGELDKKSQELYNTMKGLNGAKFDHTYIKDMVKDHEEDVAEFMKASNECKDADVKAFAAKTLPTLQEHLKLAKEIASKLNVKDE